MAASTVRILEWLEGVRLSNRLRCVWVDTAPAMSELVHALDNYRRDEPVIFVDVQGATLSRNGAISIMQIYDAVDHDAYLIDVATRGQRCFTTPAKSGRTLKQVLENKNIIKVFFDVRADSEALYTHHGIVLQGIHDVQLMEVATRSYCRGYVSDLPFCIGKDATFTTEDMINWIHLTGTRIGPFSADTDGSLEVFHQRHLLHGTRLYSAQKFNFLMQLYAHYKSKLTPEWEERMISASEDRLQQSQSADFHDQEIDMTRAPVGWHEIENCPGALVTIHPPIVG
ncbi:hypothetical protein HG530_011822 [Fusarium avenaceum]|nr:hypothetical protein HG530_011822 [Fusarium avenaceum]